MGTVDLASISNFSLGIVILLIVILAFVKKLVRGSKLRLRDFYLGIDFSLAALVGAIVKESDIAKDLVSKMGNDASPAQVKVLEESMQKALYTAAWFIPVAFFVFIIVLGIHQDYEEKTTGPASNPTTSEIVLMLFVANCLGLGALYVMDRFTR
jgi:hypothetical protein